MKLFISFSILVCCLSGEVMAQYNGCPHQTPGDVTGHLAWRLKNPATDAVYEGAPQPNTVYKLEIYESPLNAVAPDFRGYDNIGIEGFIDGFKLYQSVEAAQNNPNSYYSEATISSRVGPDVGLNGVAVFGIKTLDANDPNWSGQLTAFKAYGLCYPEIPGYDNKVYKKTLVILP